MILAVLNMKTHILIPRVNSYGLMLLITLSLGSFPIARHIHIRWLKKYFTFIGSNAVVKGVIALLGLCIVNLTDYFSWNIYRESNGLLVGLVFGFLVIFFEMKIIRKVNRQRLVNKNAKLIRDEGYVVRSALIKNRISLSSVKSIQAKGLVNVRQGYGQYAIEPDFLNYSLMAVIVVAIAEEFLFRGYVVFVAQLMNREILAFILVFFSMVLFACSHMANSWTEFICKLPLSILTMLGFLLTGTLIAAIVTHITLNIFAYMSLKKHKFDDAANRYLPYGVT